MAQTHDYEVAVEWTGDLGEGTSNYRAFSRSHDVLAAGKDPIAGSADPAFRSDKALLKPEELLVASLAQCHMLWYLHLCSTHSINVVGYEDRAAGTMTLDKSGGGGQMSSVTLRPEVTVTDESMVDKARELHRSVPQMCFIARSVNFPVAHEPVIRVAE